MNLQPQSPLFSTIPPEIRNRIFWLVLQEYDDPAKPYSRETYYTRPGSLGEKRVDTELLRTCKIVYAETKAIPLQDTEVQVHLGFGERVPPGTYLELPALRDVRLVISAELDEGDLSYSHIATKYNKLTPEQWRRVKHFRLFVPLYELRPTLLKGFFRKRARAIPPSAAKALRVPETVTFCVRYMDWWDWENDAPLFLTCAQWNGFRFLASVKRVVMELETADVGTRKKQLNAIVSNLFAQPTDCVYKREDGKVLMVSEKKGVEGWSWQGPTTFGDGTIYAHHPKGDTLRYVVKVLTWEVVEESGVRS
jgi:hypothetical protein